MLGSAYRRNLGAPEVPSSIRAALWAGGRLDLPVRWAHILARAESGCMQCGNQSRATPVTHTFHAQEPTEPRVGKVAASSIKWKSAGRAVAYFRVATSLRQTCQQRRTGGVTGTSPAITPLLRGCILRDKEREREVGQNSGVGRIMCLGSLGHDWPTPSRALHLESLFNSSHCHPNWEGN